MQVSDKPNATHPLSKPGEILKKWIILLAIVFVGCGSDLATKAAAASALKAEPPITLIRNLLEFRYAENSAIAFSMLSGMDEKIRAPLILGFSALAFGFLFWMIWESRRFSTYQILPLMLILAGALGNILDRVRHGYVVDFIHVHWKDVWSYPIFNIADSLICIGIILYIWQVWRAPRTQPASLP